MTRRAAHVQVHIGELALEGFPPSARDRVAAQVIASLTRMIAERGLPAASRDAGRVGGGSFAVSADAGERIAEAIYRGICDG